MAPSKLDKHFSPQLVRQANRLLERFGGMEAFDAWLDEMVGRFNAKADELTTGPDMVDKLKDGASVLRNAAQVLKAVLMRKAINDDMAHLFEEHVPHSSYALSSSDESWHH